MKKAIIIAVVIIGLMSGSAFAESWTANSYNSGLGTTTTYHSDNGRSGTAYTHYNGNGGSTTTYQFDQYVY